MNKLVFCFIFLMFACEDTEVNCESTIDCEDDVEMVCKEPTVSEDERGNTVSITACTYITYEHCFEKTVCSKAEGR